MVVVLCGVVGESVLCRYCFRFWVRVLFVDDDGVIVS